MIRTIVGIAAVAVVVVGMIPDTKGRVVIKATGRSGWMMGRSLMKLMVRV